MFFEIQYLLLVFLTTMRIPNVNNAPQVKRLNPESSELVGEEDELLVLVAEVEFTEGVIP